VRDYDMDNYYSRFWRGRKHPLYVP
jgi:hypothetical protein